MSHVRVLPLTTAAFLAISTARADPVKVTVRGSGQIEARVVPRLDEMEVSGTLMDDAGRPISGADVRVAIAPLRGRSVPPVHPLGCGSRDAPRASGPELIAVTNGLGRFCLRLSGVDLGGDLRVRYTGDRFHDASDVVRLPLTRSEASVDLRFFPELHQLPLERRLHTLWVTPLVEPRPERDDVLPLELLFAGNEDEPGRIAVRAVRAGERAQFEIPTAALGTPGPGRLLVRFAGTAGLKPVERAVVVERTATVTLSAEGHEEGARGARVVRISATSTIGAVPSGAVEASIGTHSVGIGPIESGVARVNVSVPAEHDPEIPFTFRYLPDSPWWLAGDPLEVTLEPGKESPWRSWPWVVTGLALTFWVASGWRRPRSAGPKDQTPDPTAPTGRADVAVVERGPERSGWRGVVLDAHDGSPIKGAHVCIRTPSFEGDGEHQAAETSGDGSFVLAPLGRPREGSRLEVNAPLHAALTKALPPPGRLAVALVQRRRALLDRLVAWARRAGEPWASAREPTPGDVARVAQTVGDSPVARWAERVEEAAYGPTAIDQAREQAIRTCEPGSVPARDGIR